MRLIVLLFFCSALSSCASAPPRDIDREGVKEVVENNTSDIRDCYELALQKDDSLNGKITMAWEITSGGNARNITVKSGDEALRKSEPLTTCMIKKIRLWNFPKAPEGQISDVIYPFILNFKN